MDSFAHVNNTMYLRWFESARMAYFEATGMIETMRRESIGPILARTSVDFRVPVTYPDKVRAIATVASLGRTSFVMRHKLMSERHGLAAEGDAVLVMLNYKTGKTVAVDETLRQALFALEARGSGLG